MKTLIASAPFLLIFLLVSVLAIGLRGDEKIFNLGQETFSLQRSLGQFRASTIDILQNLVSYRGIQFDGTERYSEPDLKRLIEFHEGVSFFQTPPGQVQERLRKLAWIERAEVKTKFFPLRLSVGLQEAEPWLVAEFKDESWLLSREGKLLQSLKALASPSVVMETMNLPRLEGAGDSLRLKAAVQQIKILEGAGGPPWSVERYTLLDHGELQLTFSDMSLQAELERSGEGAPKTTVQKAVFRVEDVASARESLNRLSKVAEDLRKRGEVAEIVDLRFRQQAIVSGQIVPASATPQATP